MTPAGDETAPGSPLVASTGSVLDVVGSSWAEARAFDAVQREELLQAADVIARCVEPRLDDGRAPEDLADLVITFDVASALVSDANRGLGPDQIESHICEGARAITSCDAAALWSSGPGGRLLHAMAPGQPDVSDVLAPALARMSYWQLGTEGRVEYLSLSGDGRLPDAVERAAMERFNVHAVLRVPLAVPSGHAGLLALVWHDPAARPPSVSTMLAVRRFAHLAAATLHQAEHQRGTAALEGQIESLRLAFAPPSLPRPPHLDVAARVFAASDGFTGDFYDLFPLPGDDWIALIGDVAGHDHHAAALAVTARHTMRAGAFGAMSAEGVMQLTNDAVFAHTDQADFCTAVYCRLTRHGSSVHAHLARAGHPYPLVRRRDGTVFETARSPGELLGVFPRPRLALDLVILDPGDTLILYTDGLVERRGNDHQFGVDGVRAALDRFGAAPVSSETLVASLLHAVERFGTTPPPDDTAVLAIRVT